eukprot:UN03938
MVYQRNYLMKLKQAVERGILLGIIVITNHFMNLMTMMGMNAVCHLVIVVLPIQMMGILVMMGKGIIMMMKMIIIMMMKMIIIMMMKIMKMKMTKYQIIMYHYKLQILNN